jgi:hypothetical protein
MRLSDSQLPSELPPALSKLAAAAGNKPGAEASGSQGWLLSSRGSEPALPSSRVSASSAAASLPPKPRATGGRDTPAASLPSSAGGAASQHPAAGELPRRPASLASTALERLESLRSSLHRDAPPASGAPWQQQPRPEGGAAAAAPGAEGGEEKERLRRRVQLLEAEVSHFKAEVVGLQALAQQLQARNPDIERVVAATQQRERAVQEQRNAKALEVGVGACWRPGRGLRCCPAGGLRRCAPLHTAAHGSLAAPARGRACQLAGRTSRLFPARARRCWCSGTSASGSWSSKWRSWPRTSCSSAAAATRRSSSWPPASESSSGCSSSWTSARTSCRRAARRWRRSWPGRPASRALLRPWRTARARWAREPVRLQCPSSIACCASQPKKRAQLRRMHSRPAR